MPVCAEHDHAYSGPTCPLCDEDAALDYRLHRDAYHESRRGRTELLARMAAEIASGLVPYFVNFNDNKEEDREEASNTAVDIARRILARVEQSDE